MPRPLLLLPLAAALAAPLAAQAPARRVTITPTIGFHTASPLFEHSTQLVQADLGIGSPSGTYETRTLERLRVDDVVMAGVRLAVPLGGSWTAQVGGAYGSAEYGYRRERALYIGGTRSGGEDEGIGNDARVATFALEIARAFRPLGGATEAEAGLGGGVSHFGLDGADCRPLPPSQGLTGVECDGLPLSSEPPYEASYTLPSAVAHLALRQRLTGRIALEGRGTYSVGRANTESFYQDLIPEFDEFEAPKRVTVHVGQLSLGLNIGL